MLRNKSKRIKNRKMRRKKVKECKIFGSEVWFILGEVRGLDCEASKANHSKVNRVKDSPSLIKAVSLWVF